MKFIFIRHAESEANQAKIMATDASPLTLEGIEQAKTFAKEFSAPVDVIFASPTERTLQTAEVIARKLGLNVKVHDDLKEKNYGTFVGKGYDELKETILQYPEFQDEQWGSDYRHWGGESGVQVRDRVQRFVEEMRRIYPDKVILAVTHTVVIRMMHWLYREREQEQYIKIPNLAMHEFDL